jgi:hypothetical protein
MMELADFYISGDEPSGFATAVLIYLKSVHYSGS